MEPALLTAEDHAMIVRTLKRGRERAGRSPIGRRRRRARPGDPHAGDAALAVRLDRDRERAPCDGLAVGVGGLCGGTRWRAGSGAPRCLGRFGGPRLGCQCLQMPAAGPLDAFAGRWFSGVLATGFADLNLRIAELLDELHMPGALLAPVLASATWDFLMNVRINDFDDTSAWIEFASDHRRRSRRAVSGVADDRRAARALLRREWPAMISSRRRDAHGLFQRRAGDDRRSASPAPPGRTPRCASSRPPRRASSAARRGFRSSSSPRPRSPTCGRSPTP